MTAGTARQIKNQNIDVKNPYRARLFNHKEEIFTGKQLL